jgi:tetratricopeptide (TPR) repeat protein
MGEGTWNAGTPPALAVAQSKWDKGDAEGARAACFGILVQRPDQADALHLLGLIAQGSGQSAAALHFLRLACAAPGATALYLSNLAEICRQAALLGEGEQAARRAVALDPALAGAWNNLGIILQEAGKFEESRLCLEKALALGPESPLAHNNLGNTCKRLGEFALAESHWLRALALREDYAQPHSNLANLYGERGEYDEAVAHARRAIALKPDFADAYINLAMVESGRGNYASAIAVLDTSLSFAANNATAMAAKAMALQQLDRLEEAHVWAKRAAAAAPGNAEAVHALGQVSQAIGDAQEALAAYERAASLPGTVADKAEASRALLLMEMGETAAARQAFDAALERRPRSATLHYNRADIMRFTAGDPGIEAMLELLGPSGCDSALDRMLLHFALGTAYLQLGDGAAAFRHLNEGNRMKRATFSYDSAATAAWLATIAQAFDAPTMRRLAAGRPPAAAGPRFTPVFVIGMPRSGTTLVEQILASHPEVFGGGEMNFLARSLEPAGPYPALASRLQADDLTAMGRAYLSAVAKRLGPSVVDSHRVVVDKMPANFLYAGPIHLMLPQARIIHCLRDPVDTCLSCYSKLFTREQLFTYDQRELGDFHRAYQALMAHWRSVLPASHFLEIDYEAVVQDTEGQARRMLDFIGLDWSASCLEFYRTHRPVRTASVNQVRQPIYKTSAGRWRQFAPELAPLLAALGTPPDPSC